MSKNLLSVHDLHVNVEQKEVLKGISLAIQPGTVHVIMGPNGSGKSSFAQTLMGHPDYTVTAGSMQFDGHDLQDLAPEKRAKLGLFLALQNPLEIEGVALKHFLRHAYNALHDGTDRQLTLKGFTQRLAQQLELLGMDVAFVERSLNVGFSGGEKKRSEVLQLAVLGPKLAILDEIDSGLDIDALKTVCDALNAVKKQNPELSFLLITHYKRILNYLKPDVVHVMQDGNIIRTGGPELVDQLEAQGYRQ